MESADDSSDSDSDDEDEELLLEELELEEATPLLLLRFTCSAIFAISGRYI